MAKIIFLVRQVEVLDYFTLQLADAAQKNGVDHMIVDLGNSETFRSQAFKDYVTDSDSVLFLINQRSGMATWDAFGIPVYNLMVDHPRIFYEILGTPSTNLYPIVLDRNHREYIESWYPQKNPVHFMPLGGTRQEPVLPYQDRDIDLLYTGNCQKIPERIAGFPLLKDQGRHLYELCIEEQIRRPHETAEQILLEYFDSGEEDPPEDPIAFREVLRLASQTVEDHARRHYKLKILHALDQAGIRTEVYGENWVSPQDQYSDHTRIHERVSSAECNRLAGRAKLSLNIMPWFKDGCSERVFNNMLNGALCVTDPSDYLMTRFTDKKELVTFDMTDTDGLVEKVRYYLSHPEEASEIASRGMAVAEANDTWAHRFDTLLSFVEEDLR